MLKLIAFVLALATAIYIGGSVSFNILGRTFEMHISVLVFAVLVLLYIYEFTLTLSRKIVSFFVGKPAYEKGIEQLQIAFSSLLYKDCQRTKKSIEKAKKYLGNIPIVSWIEGQLMLVSKDFHGAKAIFYGLWGKEKNTAFGAYSIYNMAVKERSHSDAVNAINSIIDLYPQAYDLHFQAIVISLKEKNFKEARKHVPSIKSARKGRLVDAIIYSEEGAATNNHDLFKKAFKLAPELAENAIRYSNVLKKNGEYRMARKILLQSFKRVHIRELYEEYVSCGQNLSESDIFKLAKKIKNEVSDSWIVHFEFANKALINGLNKIAFESFLKAYEIKPYDFIKEKVETTAALLDNKTPYSKTLIAQTVHFSWKCQHCGSESKSWTPICERCDWIGECVYNEHLENDNLSIVYSENNG